MIAYLYDIWRLRNLLKNSWFFRYNHLSAIINCRLDYILYFYQIPFKDFLIKLILSQPLIQTTVFATQTDYEEIKRDTGLCKFIESSMNDEKLTIDLKKFIQTEKKKQKNSKVTSKWSWDGQAKWELLECKIC